MNRQNIQRATPIMISVILAILSGACFTRTVDQYSFSGQVSFESIVFYIPMGLVALLGAVLFQVKTRRTKRKNMSAKPLTTLEKAWMSTHKKV